MADLAEIFRGEAGRCTATLIRVLGDIDLAEEAVAEAFAIAAEQWPTQPDPPRDMPRGFPGSGLRWRRSARFASRGLGWSHRPHGVRWPAKGHAYDQSRSRRMP
jgi:RNA polymerase sigma-70 factor, ECF subfamily